MRSGAAAIVAVLFLIRAADAETADLPKPLPPGKVWIASYDDAIAALGRLLNRKAVPSPELAEWMRDHKLNGGGGFAWPVREYDSFGDCLENFRVFTGLVAADSGDGRSRVDFDWHRPDSQAAARDLAAALLRLPPPLYQEAAQRKTYDSVWEQDFDALLSAPENFPRAWRLRAEADARVWSLSRYGADVLYAGLLQDNRGRDHLVILKDGPGVWNQTVGAYIFSPEGKFERGSVFNAGHRLHALSAYADSNRRELTLEGWFNGLSRMTTAYRLDDRDGLTVWSVRDADDKAITDPGGYHCGEVLYATPPEG